MGQSKSQHLERSRLFAGPRNLDWFRTVVHRDVRDFQLALFWTDQSRAEQDRLSDAVTRSLCHAILAKLKRWYPQHARSGEEALLRSRRDAAVRLTAQALEYFGDLLYEDFADHSTSRIATRVRRLLPRIEKLPSLKGRSTWTGRAYELKLLIEYDAIHAQLGRDLPRFLRDAYWGQIRQAGRRDKPHANVLVRLHHENEDQSIRWADLYQQERRALLWAGCPRASPNNLDCWSLLNSPSAVALAIVATRQGLTPSHLRATLRRARRWARRLDEADRRTPT